MKKKHEQIKQHNIWQLQWHIINAYDFIVATLTVSK